jgi:hypothetical protein
MGLPSGSVRGVGHATTCCLCRFKEWLCVFMVSTVQCVPYTHYWGQSCELLGLRRPGVNFQARTQISCDYCRRQA